IDQLFVLASNSEVQQFISDYLDQRTHSDMHTPLCTDTLIFMGKWYEVAVVSTCPHYMQRKRGNPVIVALELKHVASEENFTMTATTFRNSLCTETSTDYSLTDTPGRFFYHTARLGADVDAFVVHTNYDEYAVMLLLSTEKPSGNKTTIAKLYSRTVEAGPAVLDHFKTLVREHGMRDDAVIMNQDKVLQPSLCRNGAVLLCSFQILQSHQIHLLGQPCLTPLLLLIFPSCY
uniref:Lipocalin/cytosolic fatty-acid binding domain-containing protein n=1 Tax=Oreochromis niloticus TaxID=8128 RepID=A0A669C8H2_ORENI